MTDSTHPTDAAQTPGQAGASDRETVADAGDDDGRSPHLTRRASLRAVAAAGLGFTGAAVAGGAAAQTCRTFDTRGRYALDGDVECIEITAETVEVDADGYRVDRVEITADGATVRNIGGSLDALAVPGIFLESVSRCRVLDSVLSDGGVQLTDADRNVLSGLVGQGPSATGVTLDGSHRNRITDCTLETAETVTLRDADRNVLRGNTARTEDLGLRLVNAHRNRVLDNLVEGEVGVTGIGLDRSNRNAVLRNVTVENEVGIELVDADGNRVVRNQSCDDGDAILVDPDSEDNTLRANVESCSGV